MNTFTFDSVSAYQSAKASGGAIYTALAAGDNSPVSASTVSYITGTGETFIDAKNVIVDEPYGELGDVLMDKGGTKYWLKSYAEYNASSKGGAFCVSAALTNAGYTLIGILVDRHGKDANLMSLDDTIAAWSNDTSTFPNMEEYGSVRRASKRRSEGYYDTWIASGSRERAEAYFGSTFNQYVWPFPRTAWDAMMAKVRANTAQSTLTDGVNINCSAVDKTQQGYASMNPSAQGWYELSGTTFTLSADTVVNASKTYYSLNYKWTVAVSSDDTGLGVATIVCNQTEGYVTFNPKNYDYSFDTWFKQEMEVQWPPTAGAASDFKGMESKLDGRGNYTLGIQEQIIFPEINIDAIDRIVGMNITFVTTANTDEEGFALLKEFGLPFKNAKD